MMQMILGINKVSITQENDDATDWKHTQTSVMWNFIQSTRIQLSWQKWCNAYAENNVT